jgi:formate hydrogenlyase subunit 6/NADH:ubiquinone oxidoreductase subunit I
LKNNCRRVPAWTRRFIAYALLLLLAAAFLYPIPLDAVLHTLPKFQFGQLIAALISDGQGELIAILLIMALLTVIFGRYFCACLCPLGALMDLTSRIRAVFSKQAFAYKPDSRFRALVPILSLVLLWAGLNLPFGLLEPYSLFVAKSVFYSGPNLIIFLVIILAAVSGRAFCNCLCPTGFILKLLAKNSKFHLTFKDSCLKCGACSRICRASCLDGKNKNLDKGRCVLCLDCLAVCPRDSLAWGEAASAAQLPNRRPFLKQAALSLLAAGSYLTPEALRAKTLAQPPLAPILPPGALSLAHLNAHCSLCHSCVRVCPNEALVPSGAESPALWDRPVLDPYQGFCQYDCTLCTEICPTGALVALSKEEKHQARVGLVFFEREECVVVRNRTSCGACAELCPTGAVRMAQGLSGDEEPVISENYCIGCGACQQACPVRPTSAIRVNGIFIQQTAARPVIVETEDLTLTDDFPF